MLQVTQSPFLQALGYSIINSLWQFGLLWLIYLFINCILKLSPYKKYIAAVVLQAAGFAWFLGTLVFYYNKCVNLPYAGFDYSEGFYGFTQVPYTGTFHNTILITLLRTEQFLPYLSIAYLLLLLGLATKWINSYRYTNQLRLGATKKIDVNYRLFVEKICLQLGIKRPVQVFISGVVRCPLTIGYLKPIILIPVASLNNLSTEQIEAVLLHELAHIKRFDYLVNLVLSIIEVSLFFNPFMQLLSRHIKRERENSCDDWVIQYEYNVATYAKALIKLATCNAVSANFAMNATDNNHTLLLRVKRMIEKQDRSFNYRNQLVALLLISGVLSSFAWLTPTVNANTRDVTAKTSGATFIEPLVTTIDNPLFNPAFFLVKDKQDQNPGENQRINERNTTTTVAISKLIPPTKVTASLRNKEFVNLPDMPINFRATSLSEKDNSVNPLTSLQWKFDSIRINNSPVYLSKLVNDGWEFEENIKTLTNVTLNKSALSRSGIEGARIKKEVDKALLEFKALAASSKKNASNVIALTQKAGKDTDAAVKYYLELLENEERSEANRELMKRFETVSYINEVNSSRLADLEDATHFYSTPRVETPHTYSYDYVEKPSAVVRVVVAPPKSVVKEVKKQFGCSETEALERTETIKEKKQFRATITGSSRTKKVIKIVRI